MVVTGDGEALCFAGESIPNLQFSVTCHPLPLTRHPCPRDSVKVWHLRHSLYFEKPIVSKPLSAAEQFNTRLGLVLFAVYLLLYLGFVLTNAFSPETMSRVVWSGLNLAVVYGFGLIFAAFLLAAVYGVACRREPAGSSAKRGAGEGDRS